MCGNLILPIGLNYVYFYKIEFAKLIIRHPVELLKAHTANDKAVMQAYGFSIRETTEESCVAALMKMYQQIVEQGGPH